MLAKMKIGTKVLAGFGLAIVVAVACGIYRLQRNQQFVVAHRRRRSCPVARRSSLECY